MNSFKIMYFEVYLRTAAFIRCYFDKINLTQSEFCTTSSFKILVSERKYKNNLKNRESHKNIFNSSHGYVYVMFYYEIPLFYQDFKSENLFFLILCSVHAARILHLSLENMLTLSCLNTEEL